MLFVEVTRLPPRAALNFVLENRETPDFFPYPLNFDFRERPSLVGLASRICPIFNQSLAVASGTVSIIAVGGVAASLLGAALSREAGAAAVGVRVK